jgi:DNA polymerase III subunit delta
MIIKSFELNKIDLKKNQFFLLYGENHGHKEEIIKKKFKDYYLNKSYCYEENEIINNEDVFYNNILSKSFFENEKLIIISRATDKIFKIIEEIIKKNIEDLIIVINSNNLEKKSKLRNFFEKNQQTICIPFYEDNSQTLSSIASTFFKQLKIPISQQLINLVVERCRGDRQNLNNELAKIENYTRNKKKIQLDDIVKLTNLADNYSVSELVDCCLSKNKKKTIHILNENNYSLEDCIIIIRTFLVKSKRLLVLTKNFDKIKNVNSVILQYKPPIFWKDKELIKIQIQSWSYLKVESLIYKINEIELLIKKNSNSAVNILSDFILEQSDKANN